jgi:hypothetical protein
MDQWAWGMYAFNITDYDGMVSVTLDFSGELPDDLWLGVSNWTLDTWHFVEVAAATVGFGDYMEQGYELINPDGALFVLPLYGGPDPVTLNELRIGYTGWGGWSHTWGGGDTEFVHDIAVDPTGNIYFAGQTWSFGLGQGDVMVGKVGPIGELLWARACGGSGREDATAICLGDGVLYVAGVHYSTSYGDDALIQRWDLDGNLLASKAFATGANELAAAVARTASGVYLGGHSYQQDAPEREDSDALLVKLYPDLSGIDYHRVWGSEQYDQITSLAIPPEVGAAGAVAVVQNVGPDQFMWENIAPRLSLVYDVGGADHYTLSLPGYSTAGLRGSVAGGGWNHYLAGWCVSSTPDSQPGCWLVKYNWGASSAAEMVGWSYYWEAPTDHFAEGWCVDYYDGRCYVGGSSGLNVWPGGSSYPTVFTASETGFDPWAGHWGSGQNSWSIYACRYLPDNFLAVGADADGLSGDWHWYRAGMTGVRVAENESCAPTDRLFAGYDYYDNAPNVDDITSDLQGSVDVGGGFGDAFLSALFALGQE